MESYKKKLFWHSSLSASCFQGEHFRANSVKSVYLSLWFHSSEVIPSSRQECVCVRDRLHPKWPPIPYVVHYVWPETVWTLVKSSGIWDTDRECRAGMWEPGQPTQIPWSMSVCAVIRQSTTVCALYQTHTLSWRWTLPHTHTHTLPPPSQPCYLNKTHQMCINTHISDRLREAC